MSARTIMFLVGLWTIYEGTACCKKTIGVMGFNTKAFTIFANDTVLYWT